MKFGLKMRRSMVVLVLGIAAAVSAQVSGSGARSVMLSSGRASTPTADSTRIVSEIDDPQMGTRWLLMRNPDHPGGPGRLVMVSAVRTVNQQRQSEGPVSESGKEPLQPVIRAGEQLIVEESSPVVEAHLDAVALSPAAVGSALDVRLRIGGKVMRAVALGPGRATLQPEPGVRP